MWTIKKVKTILPWGLQQIKNKIFLPDPFHSIDNWCWDHLDYNLSQTLYHSGWCRYPMGDPWKAQALAHCLDCFPWRGWDDTLLQQLPPPALVTPQHRGGNEDTWASRWGWTRGTWWGTQQRTHHQLLTWYWQRVTYCYKLQVLLNFIHQAAVTYNLLFSWLLVFLLLLFVFCSSFS